MLKVAITGSTGLIGSRVTELLQNDFQFLPLSSDNMDITNRDSVHQTLSNLEFDILLHLAAYTNVDGAETEEGKKNAYVINVEGTKNVFDVIQQKQKKLIYISTGFVFDGYKENVPFTEDSDPHPISVYGQTKYEGEQIVKGKAMIVRPEYPYRKEFGQKKDFIRGIKSVLEQNKKIIGITDSFITPTFIDDFAFGLKHLINNFSPEIFHLVGADSLSPYEAAKLIATTWNLDESLIDRITYAEYFAGKAQRPQWAKVISTKNNFFQMKNFGEGLASLL